MKLSTIGGAAIAALILLISNIVTLFTENPELTFGEIAQGSWVVMIGGTVVAFLKDSQAVSTRNVIEKVTGTGGDE